MLTLRLLSVLVISLSLVACSDGDDPTSDAGRDAATTDDGGTTEDDGGTTEDDGGTTEDDGGTAEDDGGGTPADAGPGTPCGDGTCDPVAEVCIEGNFGGPTRIGCETVPEGCEADRSCTCLAETYCNTGLMICEERGPNHIFCDTGLD